MKIERRWVVSFALIAIVSIVALFWSNISSAIFSNTTPTGLADNFLPKDSYNPADTAWVLTSACLVLLMTPGLSFFYGGMVGKKNIISTMLQSFICMGIISIVWVVLGFGLAFGDPILSFESIADSGEIVTHSLLGNPFSYSFFEFIEEFGSSPHKQMASTIPFVLFAIFQMKFAIITPAIITGSFAERVRFISYLIFISFFVVFLYTPLAHWVWHPDGMLNTYFGVKDFAGGTVVHMSAGFAALAGAMILGKRKNKEHTPTNIPFVILGTGMLWFGWFGFNAGSAFGVNGDAVLAFITTNSSSATAMLTWIFFDRINGRKVSALGACIGAVVGLVAITPAAGYVSVPEAIFFGFITSIVSNSVVNWNKMQRLDDTLDVFACHGVGGIMGMILTAIFAHGEGASLLHGGEGNLGWGIFGHHMIALVLVSVFTFGGSWLLYKLTDMIIPLRVSEASEDIGLDLSQHDEQMDPYSQTSIE
ncbi:MAG: ammonia channel protein [Flavobacteriales bacterium]|nr:ammonia channel protein [Flavobacteriales bacterium]MBO73077.1 ammonia channel protein [Flavobacteriales bacterium]|tara:strand:- start:3358 stop:4791 length:1434 start_codon:yes stop_codon:yes gene_type:complete